MVAYWADLWAGLMAALMVVLSVFLSVGQMEEWMAVPRAVPTKKRWML